MRIVCCAGDSEGGRHAEVLILTDDAAESLEVMYPYSDSKKKGMRSTLLRPAKKLRFVVHDFEPGWEGNSVR
jgi:protease I